MFGLDINAGDKLTCVKFALPLLNCLKILIVLFFELFKVRFVFGPMQIPNVFILQLNFIFDDLFFASVHFLVQVLFGLRLYSIMNVNKLVKIRLMHSP